MQRLDHLRNRLKAFLKEGRDKKKLIIINSHDKIEVLAGLFKELLEELGPTSTILCFKSRIPVSFKPFAKVVRISEDYLSYEDRSSIDDYVFNEVSKNWDAELVNKFERIFIYRGIELGRIAEYDFQLYLLAKIKALLVVARLIKKDGYDSVFIVDSNNELDHFDEFLRNLYGMRAYMVKLIKDEDLINKLRRFMTDIIEYLMDRLVALCIRNVRPCRVIDARLFSQLGIKGPNDFILAPLEKGLRLRFRSILEKRSYVALRSGSNINLNFVTKEYNKALNLLTSKFVFDGVNYWILVKDRVKGLLLQDFPRFRKNIDTVLKLSRCTKIKVSVLRNDLKELEKTFTLASRKAEIPTVVIQHGILAEYNGHNEIYADNIAAWGEYSAWWYQRFGNPVTKIEVVGNPYVDKTFDRNNGNTVECESVFQKLKLDKKNHLVILISTGQGMQRCTSFLTDDISENLIRDIIGSIKSIGRTNLIIKLHPNESLKVFSKFIAQEDREFIRVVDRMNLSELIKASDVIITMDSSVGLEAVILRKPIVVVNLTGRPDLIPYVEKEVAIGAYNIQEIEGAIRNALYDEDIRRKMGSARDDFLSSFAYKIDGKSTGRILKLLEKF